VETTRLELFADAVFAIAATLLIIEVSVDAHGAELGAALVDAWPQYVAYAVSFLLIGTWWVTHHTAMNVIGYADPPFLFLNIALLACIAFLPFPTRLVGEHLRDDGVGAAAIAYGLTVTAGAICFNALWFYAVVGRRLVVEAVEQRTVDAMSRFAIPGVPVSAAATLVALWSPYTALALFAGLAVFYAIGSALFAPE
jgi:uncharacterized membrane protein